MEDSDEITIERRSLAEQVYMFLCNAIIGGRYKYGETLSTRSLADELKVSMMPIREALKRLELEGIVEIKPRSMCVFKTPTKETIRAALDVRELLEVYCVKSTYVDVSAERLVPLHEIIQRMAASIDGEHFDLKRYIMDDWRFHITLCSLVDNEFINKSYRELNLHLNMNFMYDIGIVPNVEQTFQDHIQLGEALEQHDPVAVHIIRKHLATSRHNILDGEFFKQGR
ncbi:MAG TPA: GntR family transcriptional regulator [Sphaerochaeta sp.]|nr:GntR family transcriptional regulator [Sphaerochaeta sp.]